ncbi:MAG: hypothetical protein HOP37_04480 [Cyclobacteriaceae bacterium]|nr:hypothetical protein [Cyclobacteriaceae bacterium]
MRVFYLFVVFVSFTSLAQETLVNDNNPPSLKWYQLNTKHFRVLYPTGFDAQAQRMANTLEHIHEPESRTMGGRAKKISVILQNQSSVSNGFVSITPRRSEFYGMPSQNYNFLGNNDWLDLLATHEYRHIVQYQHATRGVNKGIYYLFGANGLSLMSYVTVPQWFWEGDAVATETAFTNSGRGRIPYFDLVLRTNLLENRNFSYDKQYLRSYKHNIPDHYKLGFHMVSYLRKKTNNAEVWENITRRAWSVPFPSAFSSAIKKETGLSVKQLYNEMAIDLKKQWQAQLDTTTLTPFAKVNERINDVYTDYRFPQELEDGSVLVQKSGIGDIETLIVYKNGRAKRIFTQGIVNETGMLSATNSRVVWNEFRYDPRWRVKTFSAIVGFDLGSQTKTVIASKGRYAGAALSPSGYQVATVETTTDYQTKLVVLDYFSGKEIKRFENSTNDFISMPRFSESGKEIVALKTNRTGKAIVQFSLETGEEKNLTDFSDENVGHPVSKGNFILYNSPISGIDNIYALDVSTGDRFQITSSKYGAYNPSVSRDGNTIFYNEQGRNGLDIAKIAFEPSTWKKWIKQPQPSTFFQHLVDQEGVPNLLSNIPTEKFAVKKYSRLRGLINPYTWGSYLSNDLTNIYAGITSKDLLGTTTVNAGYVYDIDEKSGLWKAGVSYQGFYPIIDAQIFTGTREINTGVFGFGRDVKFSWSETGFLGGFRLPLLLTRSKYFSEINISNSIGVTQVASFNNQVSQNGTIISTGTSRFVPANDSLFFGFNERIGNGQLISNQFLFSYSRSMKTSRKDFNPKFAQLLTFENYTTPFGGDFRGSLTAIRGAIYFPGLLKHHSVYFRGAYQTSFNSIDLNVYQFRNRIFKPRGYSYPRDNEFYMFSANYALPLICPDVSIGPVLNIQRIKANLFLDGGTGKGRSYFYQPLNNNTTRIFFSDASANYLSFGAELTFDFNVLRLLPRLELGVRATYVTANRFNNSGTTVEFIIGNITF